MPRVWVWFKEPSRVLPLIEQLGNQISVLVRDPTADNLVVMGPITRDMACYPFLDVPRHMRRFGLRREAAEQFCRILSHGGAVVCVDDENSEARALLSHLASV